MCKCTKLRQHFQKCATSLSHLQALLFVLYKGSTSNDDQDTFVSALRRPSLTSRLLGKRKASTPVQEQPNTKRSTLEVPCEQSKDETPSTSCSDIPDVVTPKTASTPEFTQSEQSDGSSSGDFSDSHSVPPVDVLPAGDTLNDTPVQQESRESVEVISLADSDTSNEVDICDSPLLATPKKDTFVISNDASPKKTANSDFSPGVSPLCKEKTPAQTISTPSQTFPKYPATPSASLNHAGVSSKNFTSVPCHYCPKTVYQSAVRTCLVCGASMCKEHLRPHLESPVFQNHTLVPPMEDVSSWRCQEHQEINRIYCRQCGVCVCTVCTVIGSHRDHVCISIREAEREMRVGSSFIESCTFIDETEVHQQLKCCFFVCIFLQGNLKEEIKQLQRAEEEMKNKVSELTQKKETSKVRELTPLYCFQTCIQFSQ